MPLNARSIGRQMRRSHVRLTAEQKQPTWKNTVRARPVKGILVLGGACRWHHHDSLMLKQALPPEWDGFPALKVRVALGYRGMKSDDRGEPLAIPTRKPRQSHKPPHPQWSEEHK